MPANVVLAALRHVWLTLESAQLPAAVMGGIALAVWQHVRATRDVDLLVSTETTATDALLQRLHEAGCRPKRQPPVLALGSLRIVQLLYEPPGSFLDLQIDLLLADSPYHQEALRRRVPAHLPDLDVTVFVLSCEDLILHKLLAGGLLDRADALALLRTNRATLDLGYLSSWSGKLSLTKELTEVWLEALPGESPPVVPP